MWVFCHSDLSGQIKSALEQNSQRIVMGKKFFACCVFFVFAGCFDSDKELKELKRLVHQQQMQIEDYQKQINQISELKNQAQTLQKIFNGVLDRLYKFDQSMYQGRYVSSLRERKVSSDDAIAGYIALIDQLEKDLAKKAEK
jgi:hypothetical protein